MKLDGDEVLMVPYNCYCFLKVGHWGSLLQQISSSDRKATATNRMHSSDLEACRKKCCYFWFHFEVLFLMRFWRLFGLVILLYFNAISIDFYAVKVFNTFILCNFHFYKWTNAYIKDLNTLRILMNFLCIRWRKGGALMHVYVWEHIVSLTTELLNGCLQTW